MFGSPTVVVTPAGPTAVQVSLASGLVAARLKIRNEVVWRSATGSPRPLAGSGLWNVSAKLGLVGAPVGGVTWPVFAELLEISSVQRPLAGMPARSLSGVSGLNRPKNPLPAESTGEIGLVVSSKIVSRKLADPVPTWVTSGIRVPSGAIRVRARFWSVGKVMLSWTVSPARPEAVTPWTRKLSGTLTWTSVRAGLAAVPPLMVIVELVE